MSDNSATAQLKRFENRAQLIRHIHQETGIAIDELWAMMEQELESNKDNSNE